MSDPETKEPMTGEVLASQLITAEERVVSGEDPVPEYEEINKVFPKAGTLDLKVLE